MDAETNGENMGRYWRAVKKRWLQILLAGVVGVVVAYGAVKWQGETYEVDFSYLIFLERQQVKEDFQYDGYYVLQATDLFATTLAGWTVRPEVVVRAYERAKVALPGSSAREISQSVSAEKIAPQLVGVTVRHTNLDQAEAVAEALREVMAENVEEYHDLGIPVLRFRVVSTEPWQGVARLDTRVITVATFIFTMLLAVNAVLLLESMNTRNIKFQNPNDKSNPKS